MKLILFLTIYYEPDLGAGSFRSASLVEEMSKKLGDEGKIHVITSMPSRYNSFKEKALEHEERGNVIIDRISLGEHKSGFIDQAIAYRHYFFGVKKITSNKAYDLVFATSQRLFSSYLAYTVAQKNRCPLYLDIRDLFVENITEIISNKIATKMLNPILRQIERKVFSIADHINLVSEGFLPNFEEYTKPSFTFFTNGIDDLFIGLRKAEIRKGTPVIITYAGNIGEGQGLEKIIPQAAKKLGNLYRFIIIGDGGTRKALEEKVKELNVKNVEIISPVQRKELLEYYSASDYLFLHLNDYKAFEKVLPSKLFEYGATNLPILAGISGYSATFTKKYIDNSYVFSPCDVDSLVSFLQTNEYQLKDRHEFVERFERKKISEEMAGSILKYLVRKKNI